MSPKPSIISIGAGHSQIPLLKCAKELGYHVIAVDRNRLAPGFPFADVCINESTFNTDGVLDKVATLRRKYDIIGVVARTTGQALFTAAAISEELSLPGLTNELVQVSTEKSLLGNFCRIHGLPFPESFVIESIDQPSEIPYFPIIIKPDGSSIGKASIHVCWNAIDAKKSISKAMSLSFNRRVEAEAYIEGNDSTCLCWAYFGDAIIITWWDELVGIDIGSRIVGLGVSIPSVILGTDAQKKAEKIVTNFVRLFPKANTLLIISFRITFEGDAYIIEVHADLGGDSIADTLLPSANPNFNFFNLAINISIKNISKIVSPIFHPVSLYYLKGGVCMGEFDDKDKIIFKNKSIDENLSMLPEIINLQRLQLSIIPLHRVWLIENQTAKVHPRSRSARHYG